MAEKLLCPECNQDWLLLVSYQKKTKKPKQQPPKTLIICPECEAMWDKDGTKPKWQDNRTSECSNGIRDIWKECEEIGFHSA